jgi:adenine-specific DNA-methyltransferase
MPSLDFKGKQFVHSHHLSVPFRELVVDPKKSLPAKGKKPSLDDNLIIHGDNLEALKALMPRYAGKVDCIFIDPPYNTGNEGWCYNDNVRSPLMKEWLKKSANPVDKEDLERHDKWLCMMWPRLQLLWDLLSQDGVLFVICDDNEAFNLGVLLREICGEDKFVSTIVWQKVFAKKNKAVISGSHDFIHVFSKRGLLWERNLFDRNDEQIESFSNRDNDPRGPWQSVAFSVQSEDAEKRAAYRYEIETPSGKKFGPPEGRHWNGLPKRYEELKKDNRFWCGEKGDSRPRLKVFLSEVQAGVVPDTWWKHEDFGNNQEAKKEINEIFGRGDVFPTPKPLRLISRIIDMATTPHSIVLDSFAGSGTTAHAVLAANKKDKGNRRFILVECEDYANAITAERVRRVINGYNFTGIQQTELMSENLTWTAFKKASETLEKVESVEKLEGASYDRVKKKSRTVS